VDVRSESSSQPDRRRYSGCRGARCPDIVAYAQATANPQAAANSGSNPANRGSSSANRSAAADPGSTNRDTDQ
jgi:hypothetical protein